MNIQGGNGQLNLACTCVQMCTLGDMPSKSASEFSLASLISHLPQMLTGTGGELRVLLRLRAEQFDLLCFLLCPSRKGKDAPTLWPDCTPLCPDSHETAWETEMLSLLSPTPAGGKKKKKKMPRQSWVCSRAPGGARLGEDSPFLGLCDV